MHVVPPQMTGIYIPSGPDKEFNNCESNYSEEKHESMPELVVNEPKVVSQPKVWSDAPIIEEYESDSEDEHSPKPDKKDCSGLMAEKLGLGYGFTKKACFVCGSFSHLIRDCDFHEKRMVKQAELNNRMSKGSGQREIRPVCNNVQRVNHQNQFVPKVILTRSVKIRVNTTRTSSTNTVNTARTSGTHTVNTARHNFNRQAVPTNAARKVNTVKPIVNNGPKVGFYKTLSPFRKPFNRTTSHRTNFSYQKVNTAENKGIVDSGCSRQMTGNKACLAEYQDFNGGPAAFGGSKGYITVIHSKTKHIAIRHHFIRDAYEKKLIQVLKIHTDDNVADLLTKAFDVNSTDKPNEGTDKPKVSTYKEEVSTDRPDEGTVDQNKGRSSTQTDPTTTTPTIFGDDETIAQVLII
ncbi:hypothetical protein Tco_0490164, partial [Tanacetum coccineum]